MAKSKIRKAINFDLDDKALKTAYPKKSYKQAWSDIKKFMLDRGFTHRQYSGYSSIEPMNHTEIQKIISEMINELPWLTKEGVIQEIDVTDIGLEYTLKHLFTEDTPKKSKKRSAKSVLAEDVPKEQPKKPQKQSIKKRIADEKEELRNKETVREKIPRKIRDNHEID